jgi:hypothetical protein
MHGGDVFTSLQALRRFEATGELALPADIKISFVFFFATWLMVDGQIFMRL